MIKYKMGDIREAQQRIVAVEVPTDGNLEALRCYKEKWQCFCRIYTQLCNKHIIKPGHSEILITNSDKLILLIPTKQKHSDRASLDHIEEALYNLYFDDRWHDYSFAFPRLGVNSGLEWNFVKPIMEQYLSAYDTTIYY